MDYSAAFQISASGMALEKLRFDTTVANLANMHTSAAGNGQLYQPLRVIGRALPLSLQGMPAPSASFGQQYGNMLAASGGGVEVQNVVATQVAPRLVYEPGHPQADESGYVHYPGVNHNSEMVNMMNALRAYEANVVAMTAAKTMAARTLEIGGQQ